MSTGLRYEAYLFSAGMVRGTPAWENPYCQAAVMGVQEMIKVLSPVAAIISEQNAKYGAPPIPRGAIQKALNIYSQQMANGSIAFNQMANNEYRQTLINFSSQASSLGWGSAAWFYSSLANINGQANTAATHTLPFIAPKLDMQSIRSEITGNYIDPYLAIVSDYIKRSTLDVSGLEVAAQAGGGNVTNAINNHNPFVWAANWVVSSLTHGNVISNLQAVGNYLLDAGEVVVSVKALGHGLEKSIGGSVLGDIPGIPLVGAGIGFIGRLASGLAAMAAPIMWFAFIDLMLIGAIGAYVIPAVPFITMTLAVLSWLILFLEMLVGAPILAVAHVFADSGGSFAGERTKRGYMLLAALLSRPILLTMGFIFSTIVVNVVGEYLGDGIQIFMAGMFGNYAFGILSFLFEITLAVSLMAAVVYLIFRLPVHIA